MRSSCAKRTRWRACSKLRALVQNIAAREGRPAAYGFGKTAFGLDEGSINAFIEAKTEKELRAKLADIEKSTAVRDKDVAAAKELQESWVKLTQTMTKLAAVIVTDLEPALKRVVDFISKALGHATSETPPGMQQDLNQTLADAAKNGPRYVPKGSQIPDPNQGLFSRNFGGRRYITDPNYQPSGATGPDAGAGGSAGGGVGSVAPVTGLSQQRFRDELAGDKALYEKIMRVSANEQGSDEAANLKVIESLRNRAAMMGTSLAQEGRFTAEGGYYAGRDRGGLVTARNRAMIERNMRKAFEEGSNTVNFATDNASQAWGWNRMHGMYGLDSTGNGEYFGHPVRTNARGWNRWQSWRDRASAAGDAPFPRAAAWLNSSDLGAGLAARSSVTSNYSNQSSSMYLNGPININTAVTDANGFAHALRPAMERQTNAFVSQAGAQ